MQTFILADLKARGGFVNKDTVAGGYGSRFRADSVMTRLAKNVRFIFQNLPSIQLGYAASILSRAGHRVVYTQGEQVKGDVALILSSIVDYKHERSWARVASQNGIRVGFLGTTATHMPELFEDAADFVICGEPETACIELASGRELNGRVPSTPITDLDSLPLPRWDLIKSRRFGYVNRGHFGLTRAVPMLTSRSCPEHCTYCPHRITASFRARSDNNVLDELAELCRGHERIHVVIRDPLFTLDRDRCFRIAEGIRARGLKLTFECETRMDDLDEELIRSLHAAGLREIGFGVESVEPATLKRVARRFIPHEHMRNMVALCWKLGISTTAFYVFGFLQDTEESLEATIRFACELGTTRANFKILTPYPGTPLFKQIKPLIFERDWEQFDGYTLNFKHPVLTPRRARLMLGMAYSRFFFRPSQLMNMLGLHEYSGIHFLRRADEWSWRRQDYFDRPWVSQRKSSA
ncbi:MAG TPA: radical SAM protein [Pyrinomonadaceae bacterium]|nr:radical SAM protein [Pyrinomonadaceae bacterium]